MGSETVAADVVGGFAAAVEMKLDQHIAHVVLDSVFTDHEPLRDLLIGGAICQFTKHLDLARRQCCRLVWTRWRQTSELI